MCDAFKDAETPKEDKKVRSPETHKKYGLRVRVMIHGLTEHVLVQFRAQMCTASTDAACI